MSEARKMPEGKDSPVHDWYGQSVDRDTELADELVEELGPDEAEEAYEELAEGEETERRRRGDRLDPELGEESYRGT